MNSEQISRNEMHKRTVKVCNDYPTVVDSNLAFKEDKEALESILPRISQLSQVISGDNGYAAAKLKIKNNMITAALDVCTNLCGYGKKMGDDALVKMSKHSKSSLGKGKETVIEERCQNLADKARALLTELIAKRGMKESLLTNFESLLQQYKDIKPEPRGAIQEKSALISELDAEFVKADAAFELLVGCAVNLKDEPTAQEFLTRFAKAIVLIEMRTSSTKINFIVENGVSNEKITEFKVESNIVNITRTPFAARSLGMTIPPQKKGTKKDKSAKKDKDAGTDFTITSDGFEPIFLKGVKLTRGKINTFKVSMMPMNEAITA